MVVLCRRYHGDDQLVTDQSLRLLLDWYGERPGPAQNSAGGNGSHFKHRKGHHVQHRGSRYTLIQYYAPAIVKLLAQQPKTAHLHFLEALPQLIAPGAACSVVLHALLDLPLLCSVLGALDLRSFDEYVDSAQRGATSLPQQTAGANPTSRTEKASTTPSASEVKATLSPDRTPSGESRNQQHSAQSQSQSPSTPVSPSDKFQDPTTGVPAPKPPAIEATVVAILRDVILNPNTATVISRGWEGPTGPTDETTDADTATRFEYRSWKHCSWGNVTRLARHAASAARAHHQSQSGGRSRSGQKGTSKGPQTTTPVYPAPPTGQWQWQTTRMQMFEQLQEAFPLSTRVSDVCEIVPTLLHLFFDHILDIALAGDGNDNRSGTSGDPEASEAFEMVLEVATVILSRTPFVFGPPTYQCVVQRILRARLLALFEARPTLISHLQFGLQRCMTKVFEHHRLRLLAVVTETTTPQVSRRSAEKNSKSGRARSKTAGQQSDDRAAGGDAGALRAQSEPYYYWFWRPLEELVVHVSWILGHYCRAHYFVEAPHVDQRAEESTRDSNDRFDGIPEKCHVCVVDGINTCAALLFISRNGTVCTRVAALMCTIQALLRLSVLDNSILLVFSPFVLHRGPHCQAPTLASDSSTFHTPARGSRHDWAPHSGNSVRLTKQIRTGQASNIDTYGCV